MLVECLRFPAIHLNSLLAYSLNSTLALDKNLGKISANKEVCHP